jgi:hypothetical protein
MQMQTQPQEIWKKKTWKSNDDEGWVQLTNGRYFRGGYILEGGHWRDVMQKKKKTTTTHTIFYFTFFVFLIITFSFSCINSTQFSDI